jgi:hypothetical protein
MTIGRTNKRDGKAMWEKKGKEIKTRRGEGMKNCFPL